MKTHSSDNKNVLQAKPSTGGASMSPPPYGLSYLDDPVRNKENKTGMPDVLKSGIESLSGMDMSDVKVHYNSSRPVQLNALAYAQGNQIHLGAGQEKHLPHEAWHVVQQKQGRVKPTVQMKGRVNLNNDAGLEQEANVMGMKALQTSPLSENISGVGVSAPSDNVVQRITGFEIETFIPLYKYMEGTGAYVAEDKTKGWTDDIGNFLFGGVLYGHTYGGDNEGHFTISADHNGRMTGAHRRLVHLLILSGLIRMGSPFRGMGIAEYITAPLDETISDAKQRMAERISYTHAHILKVISMEAEGKPFLIPDSNGVLSGIPSDDIVSWASQHIKNPALITNAVQELMKVANDISLNIQKTTGVLPEDIPSLYEHTSGMLMKAPSHQAQAMSIVMQVSASVASEAITGVDFPLQLQPYKNALLGFFTYLGTHVVVDNLSATNFIRSTSTGKNLFPFFPKVPLSTALKAMPPEVLKPEFVPYLQQVIDLTVDKAFQYNVEFWMNKFNLRVSESDQTSVFSGAIKPTAPYVYKANAVATLKRLVSAKRPEVHIGIEKNLPGLDTSHPLIEQTTGQRPIPVEERYLNKKYDTTINAKNLTDILNLEFDEAHKRMSKHMMSSDNQNVTSPHPSDKQSPVPGRGRYRELSLLSEVLKKNIQVNEDSAKEVHEQLESNMKALQEIKSQDPVEAEQEKLRISSELETLNLERAGLKDIIQQKQQPLIEELKKLEAEKEAVDTLLLHVRAKIKKIPEDDLSLKQQEVQTLTEKIGEIQSQMDDIEDNIAEDIDSRIAEKQVELMPYDPEYQKQLMKAVTEGQEGVKKFESNVLFYRSLYNRSIESLKPMAEAEQSSNFDEHTWKKLQIEANKTFLDVKREMWQRAHAEKPYAALLDVATLKDEYKESFGFKDTSKIVYNRFSSLREMSGGKFAKAAGELAQKLKVYSEDFNRRLKELDENIGVDSPDMILEQMNSLIQLNSTIKEEAETAKKMIEDARNNSF